MARTKISVAIDKQLVRDLAYVVDCASVYLTHYYEHEADDTKEGTEKWEV